MALCCGGGGGGDDATPEQKKANSDAMKAIKKAEEEDAAVIKLLLLGAGESGKSTIFKQMKIINKDGYSEAERKGFTSIVHSNVIQSMKALMAGFEKCEVDIPADLKKLEEQFETDSEEEKMTPELGEIVEKMWDHDSTQEVFERKNEFQLNDSADYYFKDITRIAKPDYIPNEQDVLRSRVRTTGIVQSDFVIKGVNFAMFDVGGQRNERRKWIHAFDNVNAVIFVAALSEYDQVLYEDESMNRMDEALSLFDQILNSKWFDQTSMILFLNKKDLFEGKIKKNPMGKYYPDYRGGANFDAGSQYFKDKFMAKNKKGKTVYSHCTCATDTSNVRFVLDAVVSIILEQNMKSSGLMS
jgi:GTPase SAR1 family protein